MQINSARPKQELGPTGVSLVSCGARGRCPWHPMPFWGTASLCPSHPVVALMLVALLLLVSGCGDGRPKRVPVSGRVLIDGKPLSYGFVRVVPEGARPASGKIGPDGRFTLTTFEPGDGAVLGTHAMSVAGVEVINSTSQRWHAPKKYADTGTSDLTATIDGPTDSLIVELTWDGRKPFVERFDLGE